MKRLQYLLIAIGLAVSSSAMASMSTSKIRSEARFLTDKMAYEMSLTTSQYNDIYEINYDFINSVGNIMDYVVRGEEWAMDDYYEALDVRNDDLRWILSDGQYRRFMGADYFYRPIYVNGGRWSFRIYINYPNRRLFYFGTPHHYSTYCGAHYRPHFHHVSYYRGRYPQGGHYPMPHRVRDERTYHTYRRSDFGSVHFRPNTSSRPNYAPVRPNGSSRPNDFNRPDSNRPGNSRPGNRPGYNEGTVTRPETNQRPSNTDRPSRPSEVIKPSRPSEVDRPSRPSVETRPSDSNRPGRNDRPNRDVTPGRVENGNRGESSRPTSRRSESNSGSSNSSRRSSGTSSRTERSQVSGSSPERHSSSGSTRSNNSSSRSSERGTSSRR